MPTNRFEDDILGQVSQRDWLDVGTLVNRPNDPIDGLFGDERTDNIVAYWESIAAEYQIPMMAQFHGYDTEANTTFRVPVDTHNIEKGLIKVKINQSERMRALIRSGVREDALYDYVVRDGIRLAEQVVTRTKVAKNELMATGKVTVKENNLDLFVNYGVPDDQTSYELDLSADADLVEQIQAIVDDASSKGITLSGIYTSRKNITKMRQNAALQKAVNGNIGAGALIRGGDFNSFMGEEFGLGQIVTNDLTYGADQEIGENGRPVITTKRYYPDNKVSFFATNPSGRLGVGLWGDPPETDLPGFYREGESGAPFVYVTQNMEWDPTVLWTKASGLFMPLLYNPNSLYVATVKAASGARSAPAAQSDEGDTAKTTSTKTASK